MSTPQLFSSANLGKRRVIKVVANIVGLLLLGALGSGIWEAILKPSIRHIGFWILDLGSFGVQSYRADIYKQIATGAPNLASEQVLALLTICGSLFLAFYVGHEFVELRSTRKQTLVLAQEIEDLKAAKLKSAPTLESLETDIKRLTVLDNHLRRSTYALAFFAGLFIATLVVAFARVTYVESALVHYRQVLRIASPFLTDADRRIVESTFAQIETRSEYVAIVESLAKTAKEHGQRVPDFRSW